MRILKDRDLGTYGFLEHPLLQTADIVLYDGELVPVGEDQVPHIELAREIARKFNTHFSFAAKPRIICPGEIGIGSAVSGAICSEFCFPWLRTQLRASLLNAFVSLRHAFV